MGGSNIPAAFILLPIESYINIDNSEAEIINEIQGIDDAFTEPTAILLSIQENIQDLQCTQSALQSRLQKMNAQYSNTKHELNNLYHETLVKKIEKDGLREAVTSTFNHIQSEYTSLLNNIESNIKIEKQQRLNLFNSIERLNSIYGMVQLDLNNDREQLEIQLQTKQKLVTWINNYNNSDVNSLVQEKISLLQNQLEHQLEVKSNLQEKSNNLLFQKTNAS